MANLPAPVPALPAAPKVHEYTLDEIWRMSCKVAASGLFPFRTPEECFAMALVCRADGLDPVNFVRDYDILTVRGKVTPRIKAEAAMRRYQADGGRVEWLKVTNEEVKANFTPPVGPALVLSWTIQDAERAGLLDEHTKPDSAWRKYPRAMLRSRLVYEAIRTVWPRALGGAHGVGEIGEATEPEVRLVYVQQEADEGEKAPAVEEEAEEEAEEECDDLPLAAAKEVTTQIEIREARRAERAPLTEATDRLAEAAEYKLAGGRKAVPRSARMLECHDVFQNLMEDERRKVNESVAWMLANCSDQKKLRRFERRSRGLARDLLLAIVQEWEIVRDITQPTLVGLLEETGDETGDE